MTNKPIIFSTFRIKYNDESKKSKLDPSKIDVEIPVYTQEQWDHIEKVLVPMYLGGALSIEFLLSQVPGVKVEEELERLGLDQKKKEEMDLKDSEIRSLKMENESLRNGIVNKGDLGEEEGEPVPDDEI